MNFLKIAHLATVANAVVGKPESSFVVDALKSAIEQEVGLTQAKAEALQVLYGEREITIDGVDYVASMKVSEDQTAKSSGGNAPRNGCHCYV